MLVAGKEIRGRSCSAAQMARAAGIHVILATQRPWSTSSPGTSRQLPTPISFQVTSKDRQRTILGEQGGEQLMGQGRHDLHAGRRQDRARARAVLWRHDGRGSVRPPARARPRCRPYIESRDRRSRLRKRADRPAGARARTAEIADQLYTRRFSRWCARAQKQPKSSSSAIWKIGGYNRAARIVSAWSARAW